MEKTQSDAPFVAFYVVHTVTFVLPDEMGRCVDHGTSVVYSHTPIKPCRVSQAK